MIDSIVRDISTTAYESLIDIVEKFDYYRALSKAGLHNLSDSDYSALQKDFDLFLNLELAFGGETFPTKLFRVTNHKIFNASKTPYRLQKISNLIGPPEGIATINRCNLEGESVFYSALDPKTALWETQPQVGDRISITEWSIKPGHSVNNHFIFHPTETNQSKESKDTYEAHVKEQEKLHPDLKPIFIEVMKFFAEEFMKPVVEGRKKNYLFSAILSSRFLQAPIDENGKKIESISYPSIKRDHKVTNFAVLNSLTLKKFDLIGLTAFTIGECNYDPRYMDRDDFIKVTFQKSYHKYFDFDKDEIQYDLQRENLDILSQLK